MWKDVSNTTRIWWINYKGPKVITDEAKEGMKQILSDIQDGTFKRFC